MAEQEIDFLSGQQSKTGKKAKIVHFLKVGSIIVLILYCLLTAAVFSYWFYLNTQGRKAQQEISTKKQKIESLKDIESTQVFLKQRLTALDKFFTNQVKTDLPKILSFFESIKGEARLKQVNLTKEGEITISGGADNALILTDFLKKLEEDDRSKELFSTITLVSTDKQKTGNYLFSVLLEVKGNQ